jgi:putative ABC transport system permease protein
MNVMFMSVRERRKEIGVMKALGATTTEILSQVILEAVIITLVGEAIGLVLSFGTVSAVNSAMGGQMTATITPYLLVLVTFFAVGIGVFAGLLPAREASRLQPAVVLRYE